MAGRAYKFLKKKRFLFWSSHLLWTSPPFQSKLCTLFRVVLYLISKTFTASALQTEVSLQVWVVCSMLHPQGTIRCTSSPEGHHPALSLWRRHMGQKLAPKSVIFTDSKNFCSLLADEISASPSGLKRFCLSRNTQLWDVGFSCVIQKLHAITWCLGQKLHHSSFMAHSARYELHW